MTATAPHRRDGLALGWDSSCIDCDAVAWRGRVSRWLRSDLTAVLRAYWRSSARGTGPAVQLALVAGGAWRDRRSPSWPLRYQVRRRRICLPRYAQRARIRSRICSEKVSETSAASRIYYDSRAVFRKRTNPSVIVYLAVAAAKCVADRAMAPTRRYS